MTFDENGNLTSMTDPSGISNFSWDARNRLTAISGPGINASFRYDHSTRRVKKTFNSDSTAYLYDGLNPVQEVSLASASANNLTGLSVDEYFTRTNVGAGTSETLLTDGLGSTIALTDSGGAIRNEYTYGPFGTTVGNGVPNTSPFQYTGRENDRIGLYYYRSRYYNPALQRFLSEDPIELRGGDTNLYLYVKNNPLKFTDPLGETVYCGSGWTSVFIPDSWYGKYDFTSPCKQHDDCYGTCGKPKRTCDQEFYRNMLTECGKLSGIWLDDCTASAQTYHWAVHKFGLGAYNAAQKDSAR
jgi:RHS repeat-associated protein